MKQGYCCDTPTTTKGANSGDIVFIHQSNKSETKRILEAPQKL